MRPCDPVPGENRLPCVAAWAGGRADGSAETVLPGGQQTLIARTRACVYTGCALKRRTRFNACDFLAEWLYNHNPCRVGQGPPVRFLEIPFVRDWLSKHPRPPTPLSLLLSEDEAAVLIQSYWRGYKVRILPDVQELREWQRELRAESRDTAAPPPGFCTQQEGRAGREIEDLEGSMQPNSSGVSILVLSPSPQSIAALSPTAQLTQDNHDAVQGAESTDPPAQDTQSLHVPGQSVSLFPPLLSYK
ncbi:IQ domain-containing protein K isoform X2 [Scleropages formosus]|uniref:IQ motif containing K n=1 Tax=Scleropages formosus TaxID=113540 RepID=A0A8C9TTY9_SCLFO|nr:IQ domain-containing protein K isoform X2 [Scleropages formosus]